ncbi:MAG: cupin domain-containing protein [Mucilaginibacter polytrichastri]|nr:cupin domain-containing protein [Mucilaginibacter polytrichastri]
MSNKKPGVKTASPQEGTTLSMVGDTYRILVPGAVSGGEFASIDMLIPPGGGPGPHAHPDFHESFYVLEGEVEFVSEEGRFTATRGACVTIPKGGMVHAFKNKTEQMAHLLCTVVPAGLEDLFMELGTPVKPGGFLPPPDMHDPAVAARFAAAAEKHRQQIFPPDYLD